MYKTEVADCYQSYILSYVPILYITGCFETSGEAPIWVLVTLMIITDHNTHQN